MKEQKKKRIYIAFMDTLYFFKVFHLLEVQDYTADEDSDPLWMGCLQYLIFLGKEEGGS